MPGTSLSSPTPVANPLSSGEPPTTQLGTFVERRQRRPEQGAGRRVGERRQFGSSHRGLSEEGRELAQAIDRYKLENHRRYITCDEMLQVLRELGYRRDF